MALYMFDKKGHIYNIMYHESLCCCCESGAVLLLATRGRSHIRISCLFTFNSQQADLSTSIYTCRLSVSYHFCYSCYHSLHTQGYSHHALTASLLLTH